MGIKPSLKENIRKEVNRLQKKDILKLKDIFSFLSVMFQNLILFPITSLILLFATNQTKNCEKISVGFCGSYSGNSRALFKYMKKYPNKYNIFWCSWDFSTLKIVRQTNGKAFYRNVILGGGLPYFIDTNVWVVTNVGENLIPFVPHKDYMVVQLFHGAGLKPKFRNSNFYEKYDKCCVPSLFNKNKQIEICNAPENKLVVTGYPRIDLLLKYLNIPKQKLLNELGLPTNKKIILYAPTWKMKGFDNWGDGLWPWNDEYEQFEDFCFFCEKNNLVLVLRLHSQAKLKKNKIKRKKLNSIIKKYDNVFWKDKENVICPTKLLAVSDILITDWSSIFTDFYLTKRPIIFLEEKKKKRFVQKQQSSQVPLSFRAGEIVNSEKEFYVALEIVLNKGNRFKEDQEKFFKILMGEPDGEASKRVTRVIDKLVEK